MGSAKSVPRKLTIDNPEDATVIKVTENVVGRLQDIKTQTSSISASKSSPPQSSVLHETTTIAADDTTEAKTVYVTSHQIRNQIDAAIDSNNLYWDNRLKVLRESYNRVNSELKNEYDKAIAEVNQSLGKRYQVIEKIRLQSCEEPKQAMLHCYNMHPDRSLLCYEQVRNFNRCVTDQTNTLLKAN